MSTGDDIQINWENRLKSLCSYIAFSINEKNSILSTPGYFNGNESDFESPYVLEAAVEGIYIAIKAKWGIDDYEYPSHVNILFWIALELRSKYKDWHNLDSDLVKLMIAACRYFALLESINKESGLEYMDNLPWHRIIR